MEGIASQEMRMSEVIKTEVKTEVEGEFYTCMVSENYEDQISEENSESSSKSVNDIFLPLRCRLCAFPNNDMVDIFSSNAWEEDISEMIKRCLPIVVRETDTLPKQACRFCLEKLELCFQFQRTVTEAEKLLLASDSQSRVIHEEIEQNHHSLSPCNEPCEMMGHDNIERLLKPFPAIGIDENESDPIAAEKQITHANVESNPVSTSLEPCSVTLVCTKTLCRPNLDRNGKRNSITDEQQRADLPMDILNTRRAYASCIDVQSLCKSGVPEKTRGGFLAMGQEILSTAYCEEEFENHGSITVSQEAHPIKTHSGRKSGVNPFTSGGRRNRCPSDPKGLYECFLCKKTFNASSALRLHKADHSKNGDYRCSMCDKSFQFESTMKLHMVVHSGEKPWECDYCKKRYNVKSNLKQHLSSCKQRTDISEECHECNLCKQLFKSKRSLRDHYKFHTGKGLHNCQYCEKKFTSRSVRDRHHHVHTNEQPYECASCQKRYKETTGLRRHNCPFK